MRRGALLNVAQLSGMLPTSVAGGEKAAGNWSLMAGFCGPGSLMLLGFLALMAPCGGSLGFAFTHEPARSHFWHLFLVFLLVWGSKKKNKKKQKKDAPRGEGGCGEVFWGLVVRAAEERRDRSL